MATSLVQVQGIGRPRKGPQVPCPSLSANVEAESADPTSILSLYRALIGLRRAEPALGTGRYEPVVTSGELVAYLRTHGGKRFLVALDLGAEPHAVAYREAGPHARTRCPRISIAAGSASPLRSACARTRASSSRCTRRSEHRPASVPGGRRARPITGAGAHS